MEPTHERRGYPEDQQERERARLPTRGKHRLVPPYLLARPVDDLHHMSTLPQPALSFDVGAAMARSRERSNVNAAADHLFAALRSDYQRAGMDAAEVDRHLRGAAEAIGVTASREHVTCALIILQLARARGWRGFGLTDTETRH